MAKPNYSFAKRQRDLAKKKKKEDKKARKAAASENPSTADDESERSGETAGEAGQPAE